MLKLTWPGIQWYFYSKGVINSKKREHKKFLEGNQYLFKATTWPTLGRIAPQRLTRTTCCRAVIYVTSEALKIYWKYKLPCSFCSEGATVQLAWLENLLQGPTQGRYVIKNTSNWFWWQENLACNKTWMGVHLLFESRCTEVKRTARCSSLTESIMMDPHGNWRLERQLEIREKNL